MSADLPPIPSCHLYVYPMVKWFNIEMITDIAALMVRQFCRGKFVISNLRIGVNYFVGANSPPQELVLRDIYQDNLPRHLVA